MSAALAIGVRPWIAEGAPATHAAELRSDDWQQSMGRYHGIPQQDRADGPVRGLQDGWAINNVCGVMFTPMVAEEIATAGASWVRINFRLGGSYNWTEVASCDGASALDSYDTVVSNARAAGLNVLGLLSNESWPGSQAAWQANSAEQNPGSSGDNAYLEAFSHDAAGVLFEHFSGRVAAWEVWNEPNAYTSYAPGTGYTGSTFIYPSNFAWLLRRVYEEAHAGGSPEAVLVAGGVFGHDPPSALAAAGVPFKRGDPQTPSYAVREGATAGTSNADGVSADSGAVYLASTYAQGIAQASWDQVWAAYGSYPLDGIGQHIYIDQGSLTSAAKITSYLDAVRAVALEHGAPFPSTWVTEVGWATNYIAYATQAANLSTAFDRFAATDYVAVPFWFQLRDIAAANLYYGLLTPFDPPWTRKPAWDAYSAPPNPPTPTDTSTPTFTPTGTLTQTPTDALTPNPSSTPAVTPTSTVTAMPVLNFSFLPLVLRSDSPDARDVGARG